MSRYRTSSDPLRLALARRFAAAVALVVTLVALCNVLPFGGMQQVQAAPAAQQAQRLATQSDDPLTVRFPSTVNNLTDSAVALDYSDSLFAEPASTFDSSLAYASLCMAAASGSSNASPSFKNSTAYTFLHDVVRCNHMEFNNWDNTPLQESNVATAIGVKEIQAPKADGTGTESCKLVVLGVRGLGYDAEWASNFTAGADGDHQGFADTRDRVLFELLSFIRWNTSNGDRIKIWMSGFSRAGAVANMTGAWLDIWAGQNGGTATGISPTIAHASGTYRAEDMRWNESRSIDLEGRHISSEDVYCYPAAVPQGAAKTNVEAYNDRCVGIHNLLIPDDWIPQIAMEWWGFDRWGTDHDVTSPDHAAAPDRDTPFLPAREQALKSMLDRLKTISPNSAFTSPWFKQYYFSLWYKKAKEDTGGQGNKFVSKGKALTSQQGRYFDEFGQFVTDAAGANTRADFVGNYQDAFVYLSRTLLSIPSNQYSKLGGAFNTQLTNALRTKLNLPNLNLKSPGADALRLLTLVTDNTGDLAEVLNTTLKGTCTEVGVTYDEAKMTSTATSLAALIKGVVKKDATSFYHLMTVAQGLNGVIQAHMPESYLAWFEGCERKSVDPTQINRALITFYGNYTGSYSEAQSERIFEQEIFQGDTLFITDEDAPEIGGVTVDDGTLHYPTPEREGYTFAGWESKPVGLLADQSYADTDLISYYDFPEDAATSGAVSLFAVWEPDDDVTGMVSVMSTQEKIEQMIVPAMRTWDGTDLTTLEGHDELAEALRNHNYGGVLLYAQNVKDVAQTATLVDQLNENNEERSFIPYLMCVDGEGGLVQRLNMGTRMNGSMAIGATRNAGDNALTTGRIIGKELAACGFNVDFAPDADVNSNPANPVIGTRSFADDAATVATLGPRFATGLAESKVVATYKHFPGHGDTSVDTHSDETSVMKTYDQLNQTEFVPFRQAVQAGADMIMTAHVSLPLADDAHELGDGTTGYYPATMSPRVLSGYLREGMGYKGVIITDAMEMDALYKRQLVPGDNVNRSVEYCANLGAKVIEAGGDILLLPADMKNEAALAFMDDYVDELVTRVNDSGVLTSQVDAAVTRILKLKQKYGLLDDTPKAPLDERIAEAQELVGCDEHHAAEKSIAQDAVTLLKNADHTLPVAGHTGNVVLVGRNESEIKTIDYAVRQAQASGAVSANARIVNLATGTSTGPADAPITISIDYYRTYDTAEHLRITDELRDAVSKADAVAVFTTTYGIGGLASTAVQVQATEELMTLAYTAGATLTVVSDNLPYDVARFPEADAHVCAYMAAGLGVDPAQRDAQGHQQAFNANVVAAVEMLFDGFQPHGRVPVNVPNVKVNPDGSAAYEDSYAYNRWSGQDGFDYAVIRGAGGTYSGDAPSDLNFLANARSDKLATVSVDGNTLTPDAFEVKPGHTELTLKSNYLNTLSAGNHTLELAYNYPEGTVTVPTTFTVNSAARQMFRLYNPNSGEHFYTASAYERDVVQAAGWTYEGPSWKAPASGQPVYRLYNPYAGDHHYTINEGEKDALVDVGWLYEGVGWFSAPNTGVPIWREYNPNAISGAHNFTPDANEHIQLVLLGWRGEGVAWYGVR